MSGNETYFFSNSCLLVAAVLITYDTLLTFSREVQCIWTKKPNLVTVLFILQRYCTLIELVVLGLPAVMPINLLGCEMTSIMAYVVDVLGMFGIAFFSALRVWVICRLKWVPALVVFSFSIFVPCVNIYNYSRPQTFTIDGGCSATFLSVAPASLPIVTRGIAIASDLLVLLITWKQTAYALETRREMEEFKPPYSTLIIRDGTLYFASLLALNVVTLLLDIFLRDNTSGSTSFVYINEAMATNLVARFILDLRDVRQESCGFQSGLASTMSLRFAGALTGNLGAPLGLGSTWITGQADDVENYSASQCEEAEKLFLAGLDRLARGGDVESPSPDTISCHGSIELVSQSRQDQGGKAMVVS